MKRILAGLMSVMIVLSLCGCSGLFNPNKETETEYKARIKKELDAIPVEATGYKLVSSYDKTITYDQEYVGNCGGGVKFKMKVGDVCYNVVSVNNGTCSDGDFGFEISIEDGEKKWRTYNYDERYKDFGWVFEFISFDEKIFVIRIVEKVAWRRAATDFFPPTLFMYNFEENEMKYIGYYEDWFEYSIFDYDKTNVAIEKI